MKVKNNFLSCDVIIKGTEVRLTGMVYNPSAYQQMIVIAPNPMNRITSYSGSGLPYPCPNMAFENTPNKEAVPKTGAFDVKFFYPNSYYLDNNMEKVPPSIFFILHRPSVAEPESIRIELEDNCVLRTLTHRPQRNGPQFYASKDTLIVPQTAEGVMRTLKEYKVKYSLA